MCLFPCFRSPIPDYYSITAEIARDRTTAAEYIKCDSKDQWKTECPKGYNDGDNFLFRSINEPCQKMVSIAEEQLLFVWILFYFVFRMPPHNVLMKWCDQFDGLAQDCGISRAYNLESLQYYAKPLSLWYNFVNIFSFVTICPHCVIPVNTGSSFNKTTSFHAFGIPIIKMICRGTIRIHSHLDAVDWYLRRMGIKWFQMRLHWVWNRFIPEGVANIDLPQWRCCGFFVSFSNKCK